MPINFTPDFTLDSNYNPKSGFKRVIIGNGTPITESEMNEMQLIQQENNRLIAKLLYGEQKGIVSGDFNEVGSNKVMSDNLVLFYNTELINLGNYDVGLLPEGKKIIFKITKEVVTGDSILTEYGINTNPTIVNKIKDSRYGGQETTRREMYKVQRIERTNTTPTTALDEIEVIRRINGKLELLIPIISPREAKVNGRNLILNSAMSKDYPTTYFEHRVYENSIPTNFSYETSNETYPMGMNAITTNTLLASSTISYAWATKNTFNKYQTDYLPLNKYYTFSVKVKVSTASKVRVIVSENYSGPITNITPEQGWVTVSASFKLLKYLTNGFEFGVDVISTTLGNKITVTEPKLEFGSIATKFEINSYDSVVTNDSVNQKIMESNNKLNTHIDDTTSHIGNFVCSTTGGTAVKTLDGIKSNDLSIGRIINVKFNESNTAKATTVIEANGITYQTITQNGEFFFEFLSGRTYTFRVETRIENSSTNYYLVLLEEPEINLDRLNTYKSAKDSNGIFTVIEYKDVTNAVICKSTLSGGTSPKYTTRKLEYFNPKVSTTVPYFTRTRTLSYDASGDLISEVNI